MKLDEMIFNELPDAPLPMRYELQGQITPLISLINRLPMLRQMTIVELLRAYYVDPIKGEMRNEK